MSAKTNMEIGFAAGCDYDDIHIKEGELLTRVPVIVAYFNLAYKEWADQDLDMSSDEIVDTINGLTFSEEMDASDRELAVLDALQARKQGEVGEDVTPIMDEISAQRVRADASNFGARLPKAFTEHCNAYLEALYTTRFACLVCLDDVAGRVWMNTTTDRNWKGGAWTRDEIIGLPVPGTKAPKNTVIDNSNRLHWDYYTYKSGKTVINSSFYLDAVIATNAGSEIWEKWQTLKDKASSNAEDAQMKESLKKMLNDCAKFLRDGVTVAKALIELERLGGEVSYQVQRESDGSPLKNTVYPVSIWPVNAMNKAEPLTLGSMKTMLKLNPDKENVIDVAIDNGGTWEAYRAAMPQKAPKGADAEIKVSTAKQFESAMHALHRFLSGHGDTLVNKALENKETVDSFLDDFGGFMTIATPLWKSYEAEYKILKAKEKTANRKVA